MTRHPALRPPQTTRPTLRPIGLRCEGRVNPDGIDTRHPVLSWELDAAPGSRGMRMTACEILVATSPDLLSPDEADVWRSGPIDPPAGVGVGYAGPALSSLTHYKWAVRVRGAGGIWSDWNATGEWSTGLLDPEREWVASWVHAPCTTGEPRSEAEGTEPANPPDPWIVREFELDAVSGEAVVLVASIGYHELYVNGQRVGDRVLAPNLCDYSQRAFYVSYRIGEYLRPGTNVIGLWLGAGWSRFRFFRRPDRPGSPVAALQLHLEGNIHEPFLTTDTSWLAHPSPNRLLGTWDFRDFGGESYDARAEKPDWCEPGVDRSDWQPVEICPLRIQLSPDPVEPNMRQTPLQPASVVETSPGVCLIDFGRAFTGMVEVPIEAAPGSRVSLEFSECEDKSITHAMRSEYIVGPTGRGVFRHRFNYTAGRWLTLRGVNAPPTLEQVRAWPVRNAFARAAAFDSSSARLNRILETTCWTFENLTLGGYICDCPHRERMGYGGDGHATVTTGLYHYRLEAFLSKWNRDWHDVQGRPPAWTTAEDPRTHEPSPPSHPGEMPYTAPTYWGGGGPAWNGLCVHLPWQLYRFCGDKRVLASSLPSIARWLTFLDTHVKEGLLRRWGGKWDFLGDWLWPGAAKGTHAETMQTLFFNNAYWIVSLATAEKIARVVGEHALAKLWAERAARVRKAVHEAFYDPANSTYVHGGQAVLALALLASVPPADLRPAIERRLDEEIRDVRGGHIHAGITGGTLLYQYLTEAHRHDLLHLMTNQPTYPGWHYMLEQGATTFWETWHPPEGDHSRLHSSFLYVGSWPIAGVLGILPLEPGFARIQIWPGPLDAPDLSWARGHHECVRGRIEVAWERTDNQFRLDVRIPPGTSAEVALPASAWEDIREGEQPIDGSAHVRVLRQEAGRHIVEIDCGEYRFESRMSHASGA